MNPIQKFFSCWVVVLAGILCAAPFSSRAQLNPFQFRTNADGTITITGGGVSGNVLIIPAATNGYPITGIGNGAYMNYQVTSVILSDTITNIGYSAFYACNYMTNLHLGSNLLTVDNSAFYGCSSLPDLVLPDSVTNISSAFFSCARLTNIFIGKGLKSINAASEGAFFRCPNLAQITVDPLNPFLSSSDNVLYDKDQTVLFKCGTAHGQGFIVPPSVTNLANFAFSQCINLTAFTIPDTVTSVGSNIFYLCTNLTDVVVGKGVSYLPEYVFQSCSNLLSVTLSATVMNITPGAFDSCPRLSSVYFLGDAPPDYPNLFYKQTNTVVYYLPGAVGFGPTLGGQPALQLGQAMQSVKLDTASPGGQFAFDINWAHGRSVVVEASTNLAAPGWIPVTTNNIDLDSPHFSDPDFGSYPVRYYRIRSP